MPRRAPPPEAVAPIDTLRPPPPPSPLIQKLRTDWRWAGISQFMSMFQHALGLIDWDIEELERDIDGDETRLLPDILAKLLLTLTYNRQINRDNAIDWLRQQLISRTPETNPLGTVEAPVSWDALGLSQKVAVLWDLCEWQMLEPTRFRALLQDEEETTWASHPRVEPVGWDKSGNTYFLFDDNRLWIQRLPPAPPRPPKKSSLKAKRAMKRPRPRPRPSASSETQAKKSHKRRSPPPASSPPPPPPVEEPLSGQRRRTQVQFYGNPLPTAQALKRGAPTPDSRSPQTAKATRSSTRHSGVGVEPSTLPENPTRSSRSSALSQVPVKVDAKVAEDDTESELSELSELTDLTKEEEHEEAAGKPGSVPAPVSVAVETVGIEKAGNASDDESLTPISDEEPSPGSMLVKGRFSEQPAGSDIKEETGPGVEAKAEEDVEPKSEEQEEAEDGDIEMAEAEEDDKDQETDIVKLAVKEATNLPEGFVEWEAICVTLFDWRTFPAQFAKSRDPDEKALYRLLTDHVGPTVIEALIAKEHERLRQEAINNRKRSSRIAMRESEQEEKLRKDRAEREMVDRMEKARREEARAEREEREAIAREKAREDRLKEREQRAQAREEAVVQRMVAEQNAKDKAERARLRRARRRLGETVDTSSESEGEGVRSRAVSSKRSRANGTSSAAPSPAPLPAVVAPKIALPSKAADRPGDKEHWEVNCEICRKTGWDIDGDDDLVCCEDCGKWQHVECHDRQDTQEGKPRRNWDKVDFKCRDCRRKAARKRQRLSDQAQGQGSPLAANGHAPQGPPPQPHAAPQSFPQQVAPQYRQPAMQPAPPPHVGHHPLPSANQQRPVAVLGPPLSREYTHPSQQAPPGHPDQQAPMYRPPPAGQYISPPPHASQPVPQMYPGYQPHPQAPPSHGQPYPAYRPQMPPQQPMHPHPAYPGPGTNGPGYPPPHQGYAPPPQGYPYPQQHFGQPSLNRPPPGPAPYGYDSRAYGPQGHALPPRMPHPQTQQLSPHVHHSPYAQGPIVPRRQSDQGMPLPPHPSGLPPAARAAQVPSLSPRQAPTPATHSQMTHMAPTHPGLAALGSRPSAESSRPSQTIPPDRPVPHADTSLSEGPGPLQAAASEVGAAQTPRQRSSEREDAVAALTQLAGGA